MNYGLNINSVLQYRKCASYPLSQPCSLLLPPLQRFPPTTSRSFCILPLFVSLFRPPLRLLLPTPHHLRLDLAPVDPVPLGIRVAVHLLRAGLVLQVAQVPLLDLPVVQDRLLEVQVALAVLLEVQQAVLVAGLEAAFRNHPSTIVDVH